VADEGIGIPADRHDQVFEPFNRLGAERGTVQGTGIGLLITKRLVELMGGKIGFESTPDVGTKFWVDLSTYHPAPTSAQRDLLTGLLNLDLLDDRIEQAIALATRHSKQVAVLSLRLGDFKHIADSLGQTIGDKLLQSAATRLVECTRRSDTVCRQGSDGFVVLLSEVNGPTGAAVMVKRMLQAVAKPHSIDQRLLRVYPRIGVSVYPEGGQNAEALIENANRQCIEHSPRTDRARPVLVPRASEGSTMH
jgi:diguanylate cyclase (GGDEF)-like protein